MIPAVSETVRTVQAIGRGRNPGTPEGTRGRPGRARQPMSRWYERNGIEFRRVGCGGCRDQLPLNPLAVSAMASSFGNPNAFLTWLVAAGRTACRWSRADRSVASVARAVEVAW